MAKKKSKKDAKEEIEEKIYPSKVLGLDISTACIGISIVYDDGVNKPEIQLITHVKPKVNRKIQGIEALILRKEIFEHQFLEKYKDFGITECVIESPIIYATGNSNAETVSQLLKFNALLSESVYRVLGIIPSYISSYNARMCAFPDLLSIRKFNKHGISYSLKHIEKAIQDNSLVLFGIHPFDCDKKLIMMNLVCDKYPNIEWIYDKHGKLKKENFDACDSLVCVLAYINNKKYGQLDAKISDYVINKKDNYVEIKYKVSAWDDFYNKKIVIMNE